MIIFQENLGFRIIKLKIKLKPVESSPCSTLYFNNIFRRSFLVYIPQKVNYFLKKSLIL